MAGALAYLTIIPAIVFLVAEPYKRDRFVRFHAFQCLFLAAGGFVVYFCLALFATAVYSAYNAYNNRKFMVPVIGKLAEQQANQ